MLTWDREKFPELECTQTPFQFWPWGKVQNRIENGEEDNVVWYYHLLVEKTGAESPS